MNHAIQSIHAKGPVSGAVLRGLVGLAGMVVLGGCPDAEGKLDRFLDDTKEERDEALSMKMDTGGALADVTGTFLFAIAPSLSPTTPLQFIADTTFTANPETMGGTMNIVLQPLSLNVGSTTEPREPVGDLIEINDIAVDASGAFTIESLGGEIMVVGAANPITGSDIVAEIGLQGAIQNEDVYCGTASGMVISPIHADLAGSTFAAERIEATDPASLPMEVLTECPVGGGDGTGTGGGTAGTTGAGTTGG